MTDGSLDIEAGAPHEGASASKRCSRCHESKPPSEFSNRAASKDGKQNQCKACNSAWAKENTEARRDSWRRYRRATYMKQKYGLTIEDYWVMYEAQGQRCAICRIHGDDANQHTVQQLPLHVDHCHTTGKVRGLLCRPCNTMLGDAKDDLDTLRAAIAYLESSQDHTVTVGADGYTAACGGDVLVDYEGYHCLHAPGCNVRP